jgi:putative FmdB family regulatory protein
MPTYTYQCSSCGVNFEQVQKFSDDPLDTCPSCGAAVRRVIHPVGVVFRGSGWYINDSRGATTTATPAAKPASDTAPATADTPATPAAPATPVAAAE